MVVIAVCGTPHSGKSVFLHHLYKILASKTSDFFLQGVIIDGDGQWFFESPSEVAQKLRQKFKDYRAYSEFIIKSIEGLKNTKKLVFIDLGGIPSEENAQILRHCDYYIFLARTDNDPKIRKLVKDWQNLLQELHKEGLKPLAHFISSWNDEAAILVTENVFKARLVKLDRGGVPPETLKVIERFCEFLIEKFGLEVSGLEVSEGMKFGVEVREFGEFVFVDIKIGENGIVTNNELPELLRIVEKEVGTKYFGKGVIISGRLPVWAHSAIAHLFHPAKFVAHFDPRLKGGVIVASHSPEYKIGQVVPVQL